ncbi:hypothetical protein GF407_06780 [candidate division KSB1 bacterium]|nr:hypothetical protein [candidate division KSB1 bacterium]
MKAKTLASLLPQNLPGWQQDGPDYLYGPKNLYDYIDGGAELYLSYGFVQVLNRIYTASDQPDILVDIFDMINSRNAYGVFSHSREKENISIGQGGQYVPGLLLFWKDRYFISILATPETPKAKTAVFELARHIDNHIDDTGPLPLVLDYLPSQNLIEPSIRYFRHYIWLNSYYYISPENILHMNDDTEAVMAKYAFSSDDRSLLLVIQYPDKKQRLEAQKTFTQTYYKSQNPGPFLIAENQWSGFSAHGDVLAIVFNASQKVQIDQLLQLAAGQIEAAKAAAEESL